MGRRHVKEFRPDEALSLIIADREGRSLPCPSCGGGTMVRTPCRAEEGQAVIGRVSLECASCGRVVSYIDRAGTPAAS
jgi:hypothetical protein